MIVKLDTLVEGGRGDEHYKELFFSVMMGLCENHSTMKEQVKLFNYNI
jgi:dedicator of cytokinesis protein 1